VDIQAKQSLAINKFELPRENYKIAISRLINYEMKHIVFRLIFMFISFSLNAQKNILPVVGAQFFLEPGQTDEEIEYWFKLLHDQKMTVCRIFLIESHLHKTDLT